MSGGYIRRYIPTCETYGWTGGPGFSTRIVTRLNGRSRRNADWDQPVHSFTLPFQGLTQERYAPIKRMHLNRQGALGVFLYRDRLDDIAADDLFAVAQPGQTEFRLAKQSELDGIPYERRVCALYIPDPDNPGAALDAPVAIAVNGTPTTAYTLDRDTGELVFDTPMTGGEALTWTGRFSLWVRFESDRLPFTIINRNADSYLIEGSITLVEEPAPLPGHFPDSSS